MNIIVHCAVLLPVFLIGFSFILPVLAHYKYSHIEGLCFTVVSLSSALSAVLVFRVLQLGPITYHFGGWSPALGIEFLIGDYEVLLILLVSLIYLLIFIYMRPFIKQEVSQKVVHWYYILLLLLQASLIGIIATNDLFNLFVFVEICALASTGVIAVKDDRFSIEAGIKYLFLSSIGSAFILFAVGLLYMVTGQLNILLAGENIQQAAALFPRTVNLSLVFIFLGLALKAALFPLHIWLPDAYTAAPTPSSALLAGLVGKVYVIALIKILFRIYKIDFLAGGDFLSLLAFLAALGIILGSIFAISQNNIKRLLAYSSVAQIGYIFLGLALVTEHSLTGGLLHIFNHALIKTLLFLAAGVIFYQTGTEKISDFRGLAYDYPLTMIFFSVGALSMIGIPPLNGFMSKWFLGMGTLQAEKPFFLVVILLSSFLNALYYLPLIIRAFFSREREEQQYCWEFSRLSKMAWIPMLFLAAAVIVFGIFPGVPLYFIEEIVGEVMLVSSL